MRVVHIIKHCGHGNGSVHVAVDLACVQSEMGDEVTFVSKGGTFEPLLAQHGVRHVNLVHEQSKPMSLVRSAWHVARLARRTRADVLHAHMMSSAIVGYVASKVSGVPLVTTVHNSFDRHSILMRLGRRVVAVSVAEREQLLRKGYSSKTLHAVMNAPANSPREEYMQDDGTLELRSPCISTICGLHRRKGVFDIITAFGEVSEEFPQWTLYIAGEGPDRDALEQQVVSASLEGRVIFLGFLRGPRVLLEKTDIFVMASYAEPCGLTLGEARAAGCPIIATNVGGNPETLEFGRAGRLVEPGNPMQLAAELRRLMIDEKLRATQREAALKGVEILDVHRLVADYADVYRDAQIHRDKSGSLPMIPIDRGSRPS